jgi:O-antigen/teichoic acid export membrane protein
VKRSITGVGRNAAILTGATLACKAGSLLVVPFILRAFTKADYGAYSAAFAYAGLLGMITYFGMGPIVIRDIARRERPRGSVIFHCVVLRMALLAVAAVALVALGHARHFSNMMWALAWLAFAVMGFDAVMGAVKSSLQAEERFGRMAVVDVVRKASQWALAVAVIILGTGITSLALCVVIAAAIAAAAAMWLGLSRDDFQGLKFAPSYALNMLKLSAPMGISAAFVLALERVDIWVLDTYKGSAAVGDYAAAVAFKPAFLAQAVVWAILPLAFRLGKSDRDSLARTVRTGGRYLFITGAAMAIVFLRGGAVLMPLLGGAQYKASVPVFEIMGLTIPFVYVSFLYLHALTAVDKQFVAALVFAFGLAVNVSMDLALVPSMGPTGAILGTLCAEALMSLAALAAVWRFVGRPVGWKDLRMLLSAAGAAAAAYAVSAAGIVDLGAVALCAFALLLVASKALTGDDLRLVIRAFSRRARSDDAAESSQDPVGLC